MPETGNSFLSLTLNAVFLKYPNSKTKFIIMSCVSCFQWLSSLLVTTL